MKQRNSGKILNIASTAAFQPGPLMAVYYATKAYVLSLSETLIEELSNTKITITTLCPGPTKTNFFSNANAEKSLLSSVAMPSDIVAKKGYNALMKGKRTIVTGALNKIGAFSVRFVPRSVAAKLAKYVTEEK